jgi:hypothetical protein
MRILTALAALPLLAASGAAFAQADLSTMNGQTIINKITAPQLISLLKANGYTATLGVLDDKSPYIEASINNVDFQVYFYACDEAKARACEQVQYQWWVDASAPSTVAVMNAYNNAWVAGKARLGDDNVPEVEHMLDLYGGVTIDNVVGSFGLWEQVIKNFQDELKKPH